MVTIVSFASVTGGLSFGETQLLAVQRSQEMPVEKKPAKNSPVSAFGWSFPQNSRKLVAFFPISLQLELVYMHKLISVACSLTKC